MKFSVLGSLVGLGMLAALGPACGDSSATGGTGGEATGGQNNGGTGGGVTVGPGTGGSGGGTGDGNDTFETATEVDISGGAVQVDEEISDINEDVDYFKIEGTKGQQLLLAITAHTGTDGQSDEFIDSVVTLYDSAKTAIAFNDDPFPRLGQQDSELFTVLPADGVYYIKVEDFHHFDPAAPQPANPPDGTYQLYVGGINPDILLSEPAAANDTGATASPIAFVKDNMGVYGVKIMAGTNPAADNVDWYSFTAPADLATAANTRPVAYLTFYPGTEEGSGSTSELESVQLINATDNTVVAEIKPSAETGVKVSSTEWDRELFAPVVKGQAYFLKVTRAGAGGANDFYYSFFNPDVDSNPLEAQEVLNSVPATAETLTTTDNAGTLQAFIEGDLGAADLDHFKLATGGKTKIGVFCSAQDTGSGLRGFKASLFRGDGITAIAGATATEVQDDGIDLSGAMGAGIDIPAGETNIVVKLEAASQDAVVTSSAYHCGIALFDPAE